MERTSEPREIPPVTSGAQVTPREKPRESGEASGGKSEEQDPSAGATGST